MLNRDNIIKGLECCANDKPFYHAHCDECPYNGRKPDNMGGCTKLYRDALELLKEQEPVEPRKVKRYIEYSDTDVNFPDTYDCGNCGEELPDNAKYCPACGRAVKWA